MENPHIGSQIKESIGALHDTVGLKQAREFFEEYEVRRIESEFRGRIITLLIASFGLITVLAWDEALHDIFKAVFGGESTLGNKVLYALIMTVIAVCVSYFLSKYAEKREEKIKTEKNEGNTR